MRWEWTDQSRETARGAVHAQRLANSVQQDLGDLLVEVLAGVVSSHEFEIRWANLPLAPAEGLPHLLQLARDYLEVLQSPKAMSVPPACIGPSEWRGPNEISGLIGVYLGQLGMHDLPPRPNLPVPANSSQPICIDLPLPHARPHSAGNRGTTLPLPDAGDSKQSP